MNEEELKKLEVCYFTYIDRFRKNGSLHAIQQIKHDHSIRVAEECESLARELHWVEEEVRTAYALGLLHDIGRFSQFADFGTIVDHLSVNHAERGLEVLHKEKYLADLNPKDCGILMEGIRWHNAKAFPQDLGEDCGRFVRLIRDGDKLDGFWIIHDAITGGENENYRILLANKPTHQKANPTLAETVKQGKMISYADTCCLADYLILQLGWIFDINYAVSMRRIRDRKVIENFRLYFPGDEAIQMAAGAAMTFRDCWRESVPAA